MGTARLKHREGRLRSATRFLSLAVAGEAILVLLAWWFGWAAIPSVRGGWVSMKPLTAVCLLALAVAIALLARDRRHGRRDRWEALPPVLGGMVATTGLITIGEYSLHVAGGVERVFGAGDATGARMALSTAVSFTLVGLAVILLRRRARVAEIFVFLSAVPPYVALVGYAAHEATLYRVGSSTGMALNTGFCLVALAVAALCIIPGGNVPRLHAAEEPDAVTIRVAIPVTVAGPPLAAAVVNGVSAAGWLAEELRLAVTVAAQVVINLGFLLHLAMRLRALDAERRGSSALAESDPVTGIPNRRAFDRITAEWAARDVLTPAAVLLVDLDNFKDVNDKWGHQAGDRVLAVFARTLHEAMREGDMVARLGGDEFAVFLPETTADVARSVAERVIDLTDDVARALPEAGGLGASVGFAELGREQPSIGDALAHADIALYEAKSSGKRRVAGSVGRAPRETPSAAQGFDPAGGRQAS